MRHDYDVIVIGAGPAGLAAGIVLAEHGVDTLVVDARRLPADKPCGEGLMPSGLALLDELGVRSFIDTEQTHRIAGIRYVARGRSAEARFAEGPGLGIRRTALSAALFERAKRVVGLTLLQGVHARLGAVRHDAVEVLVGGSRLRSALVIGADGLHSGVRRAAGLAAPAGDALRWGIRQHFAIDSADDFVEVHWGDGVEAYVTPAGRHMLGVAFLWDRRRLAMPGGPELVSRFLRRFPALERRIQNARAVSPPAAAGPLEQRVRSVVSDGVLLAGDAAGYVDAITGEGLSLTLAEARILARTALEPIVEARQRGSIVRGIELGAYARAHRAIFRPYRRLTALALFMARHPMLLDRALDVVAVEPELLTHLMSANMGTRPLWRLPALSAVRGLPRLALG